MNLFAAKRRNRMTALLLGTLCCAVTGGGILGGSNALYAAVVVFANKSLKPVTFIVGDSPDDRASQKAYKVTSGDVLSLPVDETKTPQKRIWFDAQQNADAQNTDAQNADRQPDIQSMTLALNTTYTFTGEQPLTLKRGFGVDLPVVPNPPGRRKVADIDAVVPVPIKILVDDDEPRRRDIWERALRARVKQASDIFERTARIRFEVVKTGIWETDDRITEFNWTLREFQRRVKVEPGIALAIGFTSQYEVQTKGQFHMGGTRGPLFPYILIREWSQHVGKPERLELLVHELGHVFGATHSTDQRSVMRPVVGDNRSNAKSFRIGFDPLNTLAVYLFCEPLRLDGVRSLVHFSPVDRTNLLSVYRELDRRFPDDNSATLYQSFLQRSDRSRLVPPKKTRRTSILGH